MARPIEEQIAAQERRLEALDDRIGRLMSQRVSVEDRLAALYDKRNREAAGKHPDFNEGLG